MEKLCLEANSNLRLKILRFQKIHNTVQNWIYLASVLILIPRVEIYPGLPGGMKLIIARHSRIHTIRLVLVSQ